MKNEIILPKVYEDRNKTNPQLIGKPKISYSQYTSYKDPLYKSAYYVQYFSGIQLPSGEFAEFGSACGEFIEDFANKADPVRIKNLSPEDIQILLDKVDFPENCVYEDEIAMDLGEICLEGYVDRTEYLDAKKVFIRDFKTLNIEKKAPFYASKEYGQTTLYCLHKERQGYEIVGSEVFGLGRKGTSFNGTGNFKMRLSGETVIIPTPYSTERGEAVVADILKVSKMISDDYKIYLKYFT